MNRRRFIGLLAASIAAPEKVVSALADPASPATYAAASADSIHLFKMLLNDLGFKALLEPDDAVGELEYALRNSGYADIESIIAQTITPDAEIVASAMKLVQTRPTIASMTSILSGLKRDDPNYYASLFANIEPSNLAVHFDRQFALGQNGIKSLLDDFDARLKEATRAELHRLKNEYTEETTYSQPNFSDMAAARKAGGYPIPTNYQEPEKVTIGQHRSALGDNTWIERLSEPEKKTSLKR